MAHRLVIAGFALAGLAALAFGHLVGFILLATALAFVLDRRGRFRRGWLRAVVAFVTGLWVALAGVIATLFGMLALPTSCDLTTTTCDSPEANFLFGPGLLLLALGLTLLAWSVVDVLRMRRAARRTLA